MSRKQTDFRYLQVYDKKNVIINGKTIISRMEHKYDTLKSQIYIRLFQLKQFHGHVSLNFNLSIWYFNCNQNENLSHFFINIDDEIIFEKLHSMDYALVQCAPSSKMSIVCALAAFSRKKKYIID